MVNRLIMSLFFYAAVASAAESTSLRERSLWLNSVRLTAQDMISYCILKAQIPIEEQIGSIGYEIVKDAKGAAPYGIIEYLKIDPNYRGRGVGTCLFQTAVEDMRAQGCCSIVWRSSEDAIPFYKKQGASCDPEDSQHGMYIHTEGLILPSSRLRSVLKEKKQSH